MNAFLTTVFVNLLIFAFANSAFSYSFSPPQTKFKAVGSASVTKGTGAIACNVALDGTIRQNGRANVTSMNFTRTTACLNVQSADIPWGFKATGPAKAQIVGFSITSGALGECGPSNVAVSFVSPGEITFTKATLAGGCVMSGSMRTNKAITIIP